MGKIAAVILSLFMAIPQPLKMTTAYAENSQSDNAVVETAETTSEADFDNGIQASATAGSEETASADQQEETTADATAAPESSDDVEEKSAGQSEETAEPTAEATPEANVAPVRRMRMLAASSGDWRGDGYAIFNSSTGELDFVRSTGAYTDGSTGTVTSISGGKYTGTIYTGFETSQNELKPPWSSVKTKVTSIKFIDNIGALDTSNWFSAMSSCTSMDLAKLHTSGVSSMDGMFASCNKLVSLDLSHFDTSTVTNMNSMFQLCTSLTSINLSGWNTSNVTDMTTMFDECFALRTLDISSFDTSKVTAMTWNGPFGMVMGMFNQCTSLTRITFGAKFKVASSHGNTFPTPTKTVNGHASTGKWCLGSETAGSAKTASELADYGTTAGKLAGTWYAQAKYNTVSYSANGGTGSMPASTAFYQENFVTRKNAFTKTGYHFAGWNEKADGTGTAWNLGSAGVYENGNGTHPWKWDYTNDIVLYAQWSLNTGTITYNANGGKMGTTPQTKFSIAGDGTVISNGSVYHELNGPSGDAYTVEYDKKYDLVNANNQTWLNIVRTGYHLQAGAEWNSKADGTGTSFGQDNTYTAQTFLPALTTTNNAAGTVYVNWKPNTYTVTFNTNGGSGSTASVTATYGSKMPDVTNKMTPPDASKKFIGFFDAPTGGTQYYNASNASVHNWDKAANATLYAHWDWAYAKFDVNPDNHTTGFKLRRNSAEVSGGATLTDYYQDAHAGETFYLHDLTFATGYEFGGFDHSGAGKHTDNGSTTTITMPAGTAQAVAIKSKPINYSISYNLNSGTISGQKTSYTIETADLTLPTPTRAGWTFTGWSGTGLSGSTNKTVTIKTGSTGNRSYTANWTPSTNTKYTVYHQQEQLDGTYKTVDTQALTGTTDAKVTPAVKSYTGFTSPAAQSLTIKGDGSASVTYKYTRNSYTITRQYRLQNADGSYGAWTQIDSKSYKFGTTVPAWSRAADATYKAASIPAHTVGAQSQTLNANVDRNTSPVTVQYRLQNSDGSYPATYLNGWSGSLRVGQSYTWSYGQTVSHQAMSKTVSYGSGTVSVDVPRRTGRLVIHANGGTGDRNTTAILYGASDKINPMPTRTGYTLTGLYTAASGGTKVVNADGTKANDGTYSKDGAWLLNSDVPVYAQWIISHYSLNLNMLLPDGSEPYTTGAAGTFQLSLDGGKTWTTDIFNETSACASVAYGTDVRIRSIKPAAGLHFASVSGATQQQDGTYKLIMPASAAVINKKTAYNAYTVKFNSNGGTGTMPDQKFTYGTAQALTANAFSRTGYSWSGWATSAGGSQAYSDKQSVNNLTSTNNGVVTLYARWSINSYSNSISHWTFGYQHQEGNNSNKAAFSIGSTHFTQAYGSTFTIDASRKTTVPNGFTLGGQFGTADLEGTWKTYNFGKQVTQSAKAMNFEYDYYPISYKINYQLNGGTNNSSNPSQYTVLYGVTFADPTRAGYTFTGWGINGKAVTGINSGANATFSSPDDLYTKLASRTTGDQTVTANWKANGYSIAFNGNGNTGGSMSNEAMTYDTAKALTANAYTKAHYHFTGWNTKADGSGTTYANGASVKNLAISGTVTLYAQWAIDTHTFDLQSGNIAPYGTADVYINGKLVGNDVTDYCTAWPYGTTWEIKDIKTKTGVTYDGASGALSGTIGDGNTVINLRFHWNTYAVKFASNGGSGTVADESYSYDEAKALNANTFTRTGYTFLGWSASQTAASATYTDKQNVSKLTAKDKDVVTLYAVWKPYAGMITYNANGGSLAASTTSGWSLAADGTVMLNGAAMHTLNGPNGVVQSIAYDSPYDLVSAGNPNYLNLTRTGYHVDPGKHWNNKADGTGTVFDEDHKYLAQELIPELATKNGAAVTVYVNWKPNSCTVKYDANGGTGTMADETMTYAASKALTANTFSRTGYDFAGWSTDKVATTKVYSDKQSVVNLTEVNNGTVTLYAVWVPHPYTITYNLNGGTVTGNPTTYSITNNAITLKNPTRTGYVFTGWTGSNGTTPQLIVTIPLGSYGNKNYTANWRPHTITTKIDINGGTPSSDGQPNPYVRSYDQQIDSTWGLSNASHYTSGRTGYHTTGVYHVGSANGSITVKEDGQFVGEPAQNYAAYIGYPIEDKDQSVTLYTEWASNSYTVKFDANGGSGTMANETMTYDADKLLTANAFTRKGYTFTGWNTKADGKGAAYTDKANVKNLTATNNGIVTLYAQWQANTYTVSIPKAVKYEGMSIGNANVTTPYDITVKCKTGTFADTIEVSSSVSPMKAKGGSNDLSVSSGSSKTPLVFTADGTKQEHVTISGTASTADTWTGAIQYHVTQK